MRAEFTAQWARDFRQRYNNSYGFYTTSGGKKLLVHMRAVEETTADFTDAKGNHYSANADAGVEFEFIPVQKKLFISGEMLMLQQRNPAHMWSRGINHQNTSIRDVISGIGQRLSFQYITDALEPEGYKYITSKLCGPIHLLSNLFACGGDTVFLYDKVIGKWDDVQRCITLADSMFIQEVKDLLAKLGLSTWSVKHG